MRNYSYFPVIFDSERILEKVVDTLNKQNIFPRRYFYPALNELPYLEYQSCPIAEDISRRVVCLPLSAEISLADVQRITQIINSVV